MRIGLIGLGRIGAVHAQTLSDLDAVTELVITDPLPPGAAPAVEAAAGTGSAGAVAAGLDHGLPLRAADPDLAFPTGPAHSFFMDRFATAFRIEMATFIDVAAGNLPSPCTVADGLEASWIAEACTRSLHEHRPVSSANCGAGAPDGRAPAAGNHRRG
ncbi:hypothetical protein BH20ACT6_BH20ACT6_11820 [soil metagenome]